MSNFIQALESRTLFSATSAALAADEANIVADAANAKAAFKTLIAELKTDSAAIAADLKTLPKTNASLLATLKVDEAKNKGTLTADLGLLLKPGAALAKKSVIAGKLLLTKASAKTLAVAGAEITALGSVTTTPLANLTAALGGGAVNADLGKTNRDSRRFSDLFAAVRRGRAHATRGEPLFA